MFLVVARGGVVCQSSFRSFLWALPFPMTTRHAVSLHSSFPKSFPFCPLCPFSTLSPPPFILSSLLPPVQPSIRAKHVGVLDLVNVHIGSRHFRDGRTSFECFAPTCAVPPFFLSYECCCPNIGECSSTRSSLPSPVNMCTPQGRHGSKLRTVRMMSMPLKSSMSFSSKMGCPLTASS